MLAKCSFLEEAGFEGKVRRADAAKTLPELKVAAETAKESGDARLEIQLQNLVARCHLILGDTETAIDSAATALSGAQELQDGALEAKLHLTVSRTRVKQQDFEAAVQAVREAIAIYQQLGEGRSQAAAFYELAGICMESEYGNLSEGHLAADKAQGLWQHEGDRKEEVKAMLRLAEIVAMKGQVEDAVGMVEEGMAACQKEDNKDGEAECLKVLGLLHQETGDLDLALDAARKERLVREKARDKKGAAQALHSIAAIHLSREEPKEAARAAEAAKNIYKKAQDVFGQVESLALVAQAHMFMVSKLDATEEQEGPIKENKLNIAGSRAYVATDEAMEVVKDSKDERAIAVANLSRAEVLSLFGETRDSVSAARRACDIFRRRGDSQQLSMALMLAARGFLELGTAGLAEKSAEEALYLFRNLKDAEGVAAAEELLDQIGPSGVAISGTGGYDVEAIGDAPAAGGAASAAGAVQQKGPDAAQVKEMIRKEVEGILGSSDDVANDTPLMDTGLDSLSAVQFRNDLTRDFNVKLPASLMFDYPTISAITEKIVQSLEEQA